MIFKVRQEASGMRVEINFSSSHNLKKSSSSAFDEHIFIFYTHIVNESFENIFQNCLKRKRGGKNLRRSHKRINLYFLLSIHTSMSAHIYYA